MYFKCNPETVIFIIHVFGPNQNKIVWAYLFDINSIEKGFNLHKVYNQRKVIFLKVCKFEFVFSINLRIPTHWP